MKQGYNYKAMNGTLSAEKPKYVRKSEKREIHAPYLNYATQSKEEIEACLTCPYKDCKTQSVEKCNHYMRVVYGKGNR